MKRERGYEPQRSQRAYGLHKTYALFLCSLCFLWLPLYATYVILDPDAGIVFSDEPPSSLSDLPASTAFEGRFPRYVVQRERLADGARSTLLVYASKLMARAAAENPPEGWETIPVEPWQIDRLTSRTGVRHVSVDNS